MTHVADALDATQAVGQFIAVLLELAVGTLVAFQRDEQGSSIAEVIHDEKCHNTRWQLAFEGINVMLHLVPHGAELCKLRVEENPHEAHVVHAPCRRLCAVHLIEGEDVAFQGACHLCFYLFARCTGHDSHNNSHSHSEGRKLVLRHLIKSVETEDKQYDGDKRGDAPVFEWPCRPVAI